tara:strand:+ start:1950 stop:2729 length:780 start_codon:yes stop_codon:yes gene_type:complete
VIFTQLIQANLQTDKLGKEIEYYARLESTNAAAMALVEAGEGEEGTVVVTDRQTAGKGRRGREWYSAPGRGLAFSVILEPDIAASDSGLLSLSAGLAAVEALERFDLQPRLKWPNDIFLSGKKCGGVLVESKIQSDTMTHAVVGTGVNVNEITEDFPDYLKPDVTSVAIEKGSPVQRELMLAWMLNSLERLYGQLREGGTQPVINDWLERCAHVGSIITFLQGEKEESGTFAGLTPWGGAVIETEKGEQHLSGEDISVL